jgi:hypothetical protein
MDGAVAVLPELGSMVTLVPQVLLIAAPATEIEPLCMCNSMRAFVRYTQSCQRPSTSILRI